MLYQTLKIGVNGNKAVLVVITSHASRRFGGLRLLKQISQLKFKMALRSARTEHKLENNEKKIHQTIPNRNSASSEMFCQLIISLLRRNTSSRAMMVPFRFL